MIGLKQLVSLVAGAIVLVSGAFVPASDDGPVAVETLENGDKNVDATKPAIVSVDRLSVYSVNTPEGPVEVGETLRGDFDTVRFLTSVDQGEQSTTIGSRTIDVGAGSHVTLESFSGTIETTPARQGLALALTGTAEGMNVDTPEHPRISTYSGSSPSIPAEDVTVEGEPVNVSRTFSGSLTTLRFTVPGPAQDEPTPVIEIGDDALPIRESIQLEVQDFVGVAATINAGNDDPRIKLEGYADIGTVDENAELTVSDDGVERDISPNTDDIGGPPSANFTYFPKDPEAGETLHFEDRSSESTTIESWDWDFDDGNTSTAQNPEHVYLSDATYEVTLTVTDVQGRSDSITKPVEIDNAPPLLSFSFAPSDPVENETITFTADAEDPEDDLGTVEWRFPNHTDVGETVNATFLAEGSYDVTAVVEDEDGAKAWANRTVEVANAPPIPDFRVDPPNPQALEPVTFESRSTDVGDGQVVNRSWEIDGQFVGYGAQLDTQFPRDGNVPVTLTVTDNDGAVAELQRRISVRNAPPSLDVAVDPRPPNPGQTTTFKAQIEDDDPHDSVVWEFSDGVKKTGDTVDRTFDVGGERSLTLTVEDTDGASSSINHTFDVNHRPELTLTPKDSNQTTKTRVLTDESITLDAKVSDPDDDIIEVQWRIGGDSPGSSLFCDIVDNLNEHRLACNWPDDGRHVVTARAEDEHGAFTSQSIIVKVDNRPPTLDPEVADTVVNVGQTVKLVSNAVDDDGQVLEVVWEASDRQIGIGKSIDHTFTRSGNQTVDVTAADDDGALQNESFVVHVNQPPSVSFDYQPTSPLAGESVEFVASAHDPDGPDTELEYQWTFSDGATATGPTVTRTFSNGGDYLVNVTVTDAAGGSATATDRIHVQVPPLDASITASPSIPREDTPVTFDVDVNDGRDIDRIDWTFGDGATASTTGSSVDHAYATSGTYQVDAKIDADHGTVKVVSLSVRVTDDRGARLKVLPLLPDGQCVNVDDPSFSLEGTNRGNGEKIALEGVDQTWKLQDECKLVWNFPPGTWAEGDRLDVTAKLGIAEEARTYVLRGPNKPGLVEIRFQSAPLTFAQFDVLPRDQAGLLASDSDNRTYHDPTEPVHAQGTVVWADGTPVINGQISLRAHYLGPLNIVPGVEYKSWTETTNETGGFTTRVPAPVLETASSQQLNINGQPLLYPAGDYQVTAESGPELYGDTARADFTEDPFGAIETIKRTG